MTSSNPALQGDRTRRFTVSFTPPATAVQPNQDTQLSFKVYDASSGNPVSIFSRVYEKVMHLIVVDNELQNFSHIHPEQTIDGFTITTKFPHPGRYHLYLDFQPTGAIEQQFGFTVNVGTVDQPAVASQNPDTNLTKTFGAYQVTLETPQLKASEMSLGNQPLKFTIKDAQGQPVTTLKPYLASFGHLVMIDTSTYDYLHVHPSNLVAPQPDANGGPTVEFLPIGIYGPFKPGVYKIFAQFNPNGQLFTSDFTVKVE